MIVFRDNVAGSRYRALNGDEEPDAGAYVSLDPLSSTSSLPLTRICG